MWNLKRRMLPKITNINVTRLWVEGKASMVASNG
jgi:hypothetical protein